MNNTFYMVSFETTGNFYFFKDYEKACAFLLESYFDEILDLTENEVLEANTELASNGGIENFGWVDQVYFED